MTGLDDTLKGLSFEPLLDEGEFLRRERRLKDFFRPKEKGEGAWILISAPVPGALVGCGAPKAGPAREDRWLSPAFRVKESLRALKAEHSAGDMLPRAFADFGSAWLPAALGAPFRLGRDTIWFDQSPLWERAADVRPLRLERGSAFFRAVRDTARALASLSKGRFLTAVSGAGSGTDVLFALLRREEALKEIVRSPEGVRKTLGWIADESAAASAELAEAVGGAGGAASSWTPLAAPGRWAKIVCDSAVMLSPESFAEAVLPGLRKEARAAGFAVYGLDSAPRLLGGVLESPEFHAVEWHPRAAADPVRGGAVPDFLSPESLEVCRRVQETDKKLILTGLRPAQAEELLKRLSPDGLLLFAEAENPGEAGALWNRLRKYTAA